MAPLRTSYLSILFLIGACLALPEQGVWQLQFTKDHLIDGVWKTLFKGSTISVSLNCNHEKNVKINVQWVLRHTVCGEEYESNNVTSEGRPIDVKRLYFEHPTGYIFNWGYKNVKYIKSKVFTHKCQDDLYLPADAGNFTIGTAIPLMIPVTQKPAAAAPTKKAKTRRRRAVVPSSTTVKPKTKESKRKQSKSNRNKTVPDPKKKSGKNQKGDKAKVKNATHVTKTKKKLADKLLALLGSREKTNHEVTATAFADGVYYFILKVEPAEPTEKFNVTATVRIRSDYGYLSAADWPLLPFYAVMCVTYVTFGLVWLVLLCCNWRDLLRLQFWIGAVIFLGMLEKAVFLAEYESVNASGRSVRGAVECAEIVSAAKRALARMLVLIVSVGFGIVKPRLGTTLHKVVAMGFAYFVLGSMEACFRVLRPRYDPSKQAMYVAIPLAVLDASICWWVFTGLVHTTRVLRLRRNIVKLSLYRHFTNTLIFAVIASVIFMIWSIKMHKFSTCLTDWKEIWVDDAFWHLLFSVLLMVIMVLWRPSANNNRYAFSPLLDSGEYDDEEEQMTNDAFEGLKKRQQNGDTVAKQRGVADKDGIKYQAEDDLKWVEENVPASMADTALPALLDSDEEIMTTKFEMSKMQ